jgi:MSHA biogenesis protein MshE
MLEMTQEVVDAANHQDPSYFLGVAKRQMAGFTLRAHAVTLAQAGRTTIAEAMRITNQLEE